MHVFQKQVYWQACGRQTMIPLLYSALVRPSGVTWPLLGDAIWERWTNERVQWTATKMAIGIGNVTKERLEVLSKFSLRWEDWQGRREGIKIKMSCFEEDGVQFFSVSTGEEMQSNGLKLQHGRLRLDIRKMVLTMGVVKCWDRLSRDLHWKFWSAG